ncbi:MAG: hypothetical protein WCO63_08205 [Bacteroidota bacterium]
MKTLVLLLGLALLCKLLEAQSANDVLNLLIDNKIISAAQAESLRADAAIKQKQTDAGKKWFGINSGRPLTLNGYVQIRCLQNP